MGANFPLRCRSFDPTTGRFLSVDPLGLDSGDSNFYRYVANNPINQVDPSGLQGFTASMGFGNNILAIYYQRSLLFSWMMESHDVNIYIGSRDLKSDQVKRRIVINSDGSAWEDYCVHYTALQELERTVSPSVLNQWGYEDWDDWFEEHGRLCGQQLPTPEHELGHGTLAESQELQGLLPGTQETCKPKIPGLLPTVCGEGATQADEYKEIASAVGELAVYMAKELAIKLAVTAAGAALALVAKVAVKTGVVTYFVRVGGQLIEVSQERVRRLMQRLGRRARGGDKQARKIVNDFKLRSECQFDENIEIPDNKPPAPVPPGVGQMAITAPHYGTVGPVRLEGWHPALRIDGRVYVHHMHVEARRLAPTPFVDGRDLYGRVRLDATGRVVEVQWGQ